MNGFVGPSLSAVKSMQKFVTMLTLMQQSCKLYHTAVAEGADITYVLCECFKQLLFGLRK